jgi:hypothetical protein
MPFAGGLMGNGYQCGMLWGAALAAGAQAYRLYGSGLQAETQALSTAQILVETFVKRNKSIDCSDITELDWKASSSRQLLISVVKFFFKGKAAGCFMMAARYAPAAFEVISRPGSEPVKEPAGVGDGLPAPHASCASLLAQKLGASEMQATMVAGLAGGIGLSGGACGALGVALWIEGVQSGAGGIENIQYTPKAGAETIDSFLNSSDYEFECSKIVGRKFENAGDHALYVRQGGCAKIIETLAGS